MRLVSLPIEDIVPPIPAELDREIQRSVGEILKTYLSDLEEELERRVIRRYTKAVRYIDNVNLDNVRFGIGDAVRFAGEFADRMSDNTIDCIGFESLTRLPAGSCVYAFADAHNRVIYVGSTRNIGNRVNSSHHAIRNAAKQGAVKVCFMLCPTNLLKPVEQRLMNLFQAPLNTGVWGVLPDERENLNTSISVGVASAVTAYALASGATVDETVDRLLGLALRPKGYLDERNEPTSKTLDRLSMHAGKQQNGGYPEELTAKES